MLILQRDTQLRSELQKHFAVFTSFNQQHLASGDGGASLRRTWINGPQRMGTQHVRNSLRFIVRLIELKCRTMHWHRTSIESILFCQSLLPFFEKGLRKCVRKVWGLRQEACSVLITTPDKRPALCYKLFLTELNQAWNNYKHETQECNRLPICFSIQRGCIEIIA